MTRARISLPILGLSCAGGGALTLERVLRRLPGVTWVYVNPATEMAYVEYSPDQIMLDDVARAVESAGFRTVLPGARSREL